MSRDWTPRETHEVEQHNIKNGRGSLWDFMKNTTWIIDGQSFPLNTPESIENRQKYPFLGRFYEPYDQLYSELLEIPGGMAFLASQEQILSDYVAFGKGDPDTPLLKWFDGKLDPGFYYRERNDQLLFDHLIAEARLFSKSFEKPSLSSQIQVAESQKPKSPECPKHSDSLDR